MDTQSPAPGRPRHRPPWPGLRELPPLAFERQTLAALWHLACCPCSLGMALLHGKSLTDRAPASARGRETVFRPAKVPWHLGAGQERMWRGQIELSGDWPCLCDVTRAESEAGEGARRRSSPTLEKPSGLHRPLCGAGASPGPSHNAAAAGARPSTLTDAPNPAGPADTHLPTHLWPLDNSLFTHSRHTP